MTERIPPVVRSRHHALDGLRGLAALAVMIAHFTRPPMMAFTPDLAAWTTYGQFGVELFFMISGFVIALSLQGKTLRSFLLSRFIRLFPIFWVCVAISCVVRACLLEAPQAISAWRILANATMIPRQFLGITSYLEGSYWTLEMELYFYITCAVCWFAFRRNPILAVLAVLSLLNVTIDATEAMARLPGWPRLLQALFMRGYGWLFIEYAHLFLIGVATFMRSRLGTTRYLALLGFATAVGMYHNRFRSISDSASAIMVVAMEALFLTAALPPVPAPDDRQAGSRGDIRRWLPVQWLQTLLGCPPLLFLGRISYPLYLIHQGIGDAILGRVHEPGLVVYGGILASCAIAIGVASLLTLCVDEPLRRWLNLRLVVSTGAVRGSSQP